MTTWLSLTLRSVQCLPVHRLIWMSTRSLWILMRLKERRVTPLLREPVSALVLMLTVFGEVILERVQKLYFLQLHTPKFQCVLFLTRIATRLQRNLRNISTRLPLRALRLRLLLITEVTDSLCQFLLQHIKLQQERLRRFTELSLFQAVAVEVFQFLQICRISFR